MEQEGDAGQLPGPAQRLWIRVLRAGRATAAGQAQCRNSGTVLLSEKTADRLQWMAYRTSEREEFSGCFSSQAQNLDRKGVAQCRNTVLRNRILDPVPFLTPESMQDATVTTLQNTRVQIPLSPPSFKCNVLRESLSVDSQNTPCATLKRRGSWIISVCLQALPIVRNLPEPSGQGQVLAVPGSLTRDNPARF